MTEKELQNMFMLMRKPIPWDPAPWWVRLTKEQVAQFNDVQVRLNTKIAALEAEKVKALSKIAGISV
jgi:hypothetical protein